VTLVGNLLGPNTRLNSNNRQTRKNSPGYVHAALRSTERSAMDGAASTTGGALRSDRLPALIRGVRGCQSKLIHENGQVLRSAVLAPIPGSAVRLDEFGNVVENTESFRFGSGGQQN
jgi:hypothetical protein